MRNPGLFQRWLQKQEVRGPVGFLLGALLGMSLLRPGVCLARKNTPDPKTQENVDIRIHGILYETVLKNHTKLRPCYASDLKANPSLEGRADFVFTISPQGRVTKAELQKSNFDSRIGRCLARKMTGFQIPTPPEGFGIKVTISYPFYFEIKHDRREIVRAPSEEDSGIRLNRNE